MLGLFLSTILCYGDGSINGPSAVDPGDISTYQVNFGYKLHPLSVISWHIEGGTIVSDMELQSYKITVQWGNAERGGSVTASEDIAGGNIDLEVIIGHPVAPLIGGDIRTTSSVFNAVVSPVLYADYPASGSSCPTYTYYWQASIAGQPWTTIYTGEDLSATVYRFTDNTQIRRKVVNCSGEEAYSNTISIRYQPADGEPAINYIKTIDVWQKGVGSWAQADMLAIGKRLQSNTYLDGLGRPVQTVVKQGIVKPGAGHAADPASWTDLVTHMEYDANGRTEKKFLPYAATDLIGQFKPSAKTDQAASLQAHYNDGPAYSRIDLENSPAGRVLKTYQPGSTGAASPVEFRYGTNTFAESVQMWNAGDATDDVPVTAGAYKGGMLFKNTVKDENGKETVEYKDKNGRTILKKVQDGDDGAGLDRNGHAGWLCTYYVYDDYNNLRCVIQPKGVAWLEANGWNRLPDISDELCFRYAYDSRNRMIMKKVPGAAAVYMIYDGWDRLVLTQDGNQRLKNRWIFTKYDELNRPVSTGYYTDQVHTDLNSMKKYINDNQPAVSRYEERNSSAIGYTSTQSYPADPAPYYLTVTYYDNYNYPGAKSFSTDFQIDNTVPAEERTAVENTVLTKGETTGMRVRVLDGSNTFLLTTSYYDAKGRLVQTLQDNYLSGQDIATTQYDFTGKARSTSTKHTVASPAGASSVSVFTRLRHDFAGNLVSIAKKINNDPEKEIVHNDYDELGHLKGKQLAPGYTLMGKNELEKLRYDYNIRGWMTGINRNYVGEASADAAYFGMEIGYDKPGATGFSSLQINGNIGGIAWKSRGDNIPRKYDFQYDNPGRLKTASFTQQDGGAGPANAWSNGTVNFDVVIADPNNKSYDENGNIMGMKQWGIKGSRIMQLDDMRYEYKNKGSGNQLLAVTENLATTAASNLSDFTDGNTTPDDYDYDPNGNLKYDKNKRISSISYNYLNLPAAIIVDGKGEIIYTYDAGGNKLQKTVKETGKADRHTTYVNGFVYEDGRLQYFSHEQGRVRVKQNGSNPPAFIFDYFINDHLGNVRMVLTEERNPLFYPAATLETSTDAAAPSKVLDEEKKYYTITEAQIVDNNRLPGPGIDAADEYANSNTPVTNGNQYANALAAKSSRMYKLNGSNPSTQTGLGISLKVMAGDIVNIFARSYYFVNAGGISGTPLDVPVSSLVASYTGTPAATSLTKAITPSDLLSDASIVSAIFSFLQDSRRQQAGLKPKAAINWLLFDEQLHVAAHGFQPVAGSDADNGRVKTYGPGEIPGIPICKNGYLYVYCSNESQVDVFFDNLQLVHTPGPILEETHYYPFGLTMEGISSKAAGGVGNRKGFNGIEHTTELDLNQYDAFYRTLDPQIGRFLQIDPKIESAEAWSPYSAMLDNPVKNADPLGDSTIPGAGFWRNTFEGIKDGGLSTINFGKSLGTSEGWQNLGNGIAGFGDRLNTFSLSSMATNVVTAYEVKEKIQNIPKLTKDDWGHAVGYGTEKVIESALLSKGAGAIGNVLNRAETLTVTEASIAKALKGSTMKTIQNEVSLPAVERYVNKLKSGSPSPAIKVADDVIIDGNHRYVAGRLFGIDPPTIPGTLSRSSATLVKPIQQIKINPKDFGNH